MTPDQGRSESGASLVFVDIPSDIEFILSQVCLTHARAFALRVTSAEVICLAAARLLVRISRC